MPPALTPRERARLKARAHALEPLVQVGQAGLTDAVITETGRALEAHELIKVRVSIADRGEREQIGGFRHCLLRRNVEGRKEARQAIAPDIGTLDHAIGTFRTR